MAVAIVLATLIASIAYLVPRLLTLKVNMDQLRLMEQVQAAQTGPFEGDDTTTTSSEGLFGQYV